MIINHNISALSTYNYLRANNDATGKSLETLSSGLRINRAGDDAAGLAISEKMRGQIRGLDQATRNSQDGISLIQTAEGALNETHSILQRMRELAVQSSSDTNTDADRAQMQKEMDQLTSEIDRIGATTQFNTKNLLDGSLKGIAASTSATFTTVMSDQNINFAAGVASAGNLFTVSDTLQIRVVTADTVAGSYTYSIASALSAGLVVDTTVLSAGTIVFTGLSSNGAFGTVAAPGSTGFGVGDTLTISITGGTAAVTADSSLAFQIGSNTAQQINVGIGDMRAKAIGVKNASGANLSISTQFSAEATIAQVDNAITTISTQRSALGAYQNRLEHTINNLTTSSQNLSVAESRIRDVDMAKEMMNFSKNNILNQAATAMLAQANQQPQGVLQLLR